MEYEQQPNPDDGFMNRVKESPRTVSAVIIVLIVAAAIYAFSGNDSQQIAQEETGAPEENVELSADETAQKEATSTPEQSSDKQPAAAADSATPAPVDKSALMEDSKTLPEARTTDTAYVEVAQTGDGLTHLARRAATRYLADREAGYAITNEHRIYIEDYIRKHVDQHPVSIGMEETISFDLIKEAVESAGKLTEPQLKNLTKYAHVLT